MSLVGGKWKRLCRLCLCNSSDCVSILDEKSEDEDSSLQGAVKSCVGVEVTKEDGLTCMICRKCRKLVIHFNTFKESCQESQKMLERLGKIYGDKAGRGNAEAVESAGDKQKKGKKGKSKPAINSAVASKESDPLRPLAMWTLSEGCLRAATIHNEETIISDQLEDHWSRDGPSDSRDVEKEIISTMKTEEGVAEEVDNSVQQENVEGSWEEEEAMAGDEESQVAMKIVTSTLSPDCYLLSIPDTSIPIPMEGLALVQQEQVEHTMNGTNEYTLILGSDEVADGTQVELLCHEQLEDDEEESQDGNAAKRPRKQRMVTREDPFEEFVEPSKEQGEHDHNYVRPSSGDNETDMLDSDEEENEIIEDETMETTAEASNEGEQEDEECSIVASIAKEDKVKKVDVVDLSSDDDEEEKGKRKEAPPVPQMTPFKVTKRAGKNKILLKPMKNVRLLRLPALNSSSTSDNGNTVTRMLIDSRSGSLIASQQNVNAAGGVLNLAGGVRKKILLRGNAETLRHIPMVQGQLLKRSMPMTSILKLRKITRSGR